MPSSCCLFLAFAIIFAVPMEQPIHKHTRFLCAYNASAFSKGLLSLFCPVYCAVCIDRFEFCSRWKPWQLQTDNNKNYRHSVDLTSHFCAFRMYLNVCHMVNSLFAPKKKNDNHITKFAKKAFFVQLEIFHSISMLMRSG